MFKINSGRKHEHGVWRYFSYEPSTDKSRCNVVCGVEENDSEAHVVETCGALLKGKNATNLLNHLSYRHKDVAKELEISETNRKKLKAKPKLTENNLEKTVNQNSAQVTLPAFMNNKRQWASDAQEVKLRQHLLSNMFISTGLSTSFLDNPDVRTYFETVDPRFKLPGMQIYIF